MDLAVGLVVAAAVAFAALAQSITGFGFALLAVPPLTLVLEPADAIAVSLVLLLLANVGLVVSEHRQLDQGAAAWLLAGAVVGLPLGLLALRAASADALPSPSTIATRGSSRPSDAAAPSSRAEGCACTACRPGSPGWWCTSTTWSASRTGCSS